MWMFLAALAFGGDPQPEPKMKAPTEFDKHTLVLLKKGPSWSDADTEENRELMRGHLAHFRTQHEAGNLLVAGPFSDQDDPDVRGLCLYRVPLEEARALAEADPRVRAGHLKVEAMTLWTEAGHLAFPKAETR